MIPDGRAVGSWSRKRRAHEVDLLIHPWLDFGEATWNGLAVEAQKLARHIALPVRIVRPSEDGVMTGSGTG